MPARPARRRRPATRLLGERGAAAVEFALVVPLLVVLLFGIIEYSKALNTQSTLAAAAREGARSMALGNNVSQARTAVQSAAGDLDLTTSAISISPSTCAGVTATTTVTVTIKYRQQFASGLLGRAGVDLTGKAAMRCGG